MVVGAGPPLPGHSQAKKRHRQPLRKALGSIFESARRIVSSKAANAEREKAAASIQARIRGRNARKDGGLGASVKMALAGEFEITVRDGHGLTFALVVNPMLTIGDVMETISLKCGAASCPQYGIKLVHKSRVVSHAPERKLRQLEMQQGDELLLVVTLDHAREQLIRLANATHIRKPRKRKTNIKAQLSQDAAASRMQARVRGRAARAKDARAMGKIAANLGGAAGGLAAAVRMAALAAEEELERRAKAEMVTVEMAMTVARAEAEVRAESRRAAKSASEPAAASSAQTIPVAHAPLCEPSSTEPTSTIMPPVQPAAAADAALTVAAPTSSCSAVASTAPPQPKAMIAPAQPVDDQPAAAAPSASTDLTAGSTVSAEDPPAVNPPLLEMPRAAPPTSAPSTAASKACQVPVALPSASGTVPETVMSVPPSSSPPQPTVSLAPDHVRAAQLPSPAAQPSPSPSAQPHTPAAQPPSGAAQPAGAAQPPLARQSIHTHHGPTTPKHAEDVIISSFLGNISPSLPQYSPRSVQSAERAAALRVLAQQIDVPWSAQPHRPPYREVHRHARGTPRRHSGSQRTAPQVQVFV